MINENKKKRKTNKKNSATVDSTSINEAEFNKLELALEQWVHQKHYREYDKSRDEIARELGTTKEVLHAYFTTRIGVDFRTWRTELRLEEAKRLLLENRETSINIIAEMSGFSDKSNFHRQFVKYTGVSPKSWRENGGKTGQIMS